VSNELTPKEVEDYGEDFLNVVGKKARATVGADVARLEQGMNEVRHALHRERRNQMLATMDTQLPAWRSQNVDAEFLRWLEERDPFSGVAKSHLLKNAWENNDTDRVLSIFNGYHTVGGRAPQGGNTRRGAGNADQPFLTAAEITQFYNEVARGKWVGREAEKAQREAFIVECGRVGRIIGKSIDETGQTLVNDRA
jgi:hypothetical protein